LRPEQLQAIVNNMADRPFAQRNFLNTVRVMFNWAKIEGRIPSDPSADVTRDKLKTAGYVTWSETDITRFEAAHPIGTEARLAFALLLYSGQRRGDVVELGRKGVEFIDENGGGPGVRQRKRHQRKS
jgi:integrase